MDGLVEGDKRNRKAVWTGITRGAQFGSFPIQWNMGVVDRFLFFCFFFFLHLSVFLFFASTSTSTSISISGQ